MKHTNSSLTTYTRLSPNHRGKRARPIDTITIHCVVGQLSLETLGMIFASKQRRASSNYGVDSDGNVGLFCEEKNGSMCSSSRANDQRAITIEVASDRTHPYAITDAAMNGLIGLCADICKRNNIPKLLWKADKSLIGRVDQQNMTVHRWFAARECPGEYIYSRLGYIAEQVNAILTGLDDEPTVDQYFLDLGDGETLQAEAPFVPYLFEITADSLEFRSGPGQSYPVVGVVHKRDVYTIVEERNGWGKLKSGAGWLSLYFGRKMGD